MQDMGNLTFDADEIVKRSYEIVSRVIEGKTPEGKVIQRCVIATGDLGIRDLIIFKGNAVQEGIRAILGNSDVVVDVRMVLAGINKRKFSGDISVAVDYGDDEKLTRAMSGIYSLRDRIDDSIVVIGNAPSALIAVCDLIMRGIKPKLVIGTPVGFVNAAESKEMLRELDVPSITTVGTRGGSTLAVAIFNALVNLAYERSD